MYTVIQDMIETYKILHSRMTLLSPLFYPYVMILLQGVILGN